MMRTLIQLEASRSVLWLLGGGLFGSLWDAFGLGLVLACLILIAIHLWHAWHLLAWLKTPKKHELPDGLGIWRQIYDLSLSRHQQARKRKKRLAKILKEFRASTTALPDAAVVLDDASEIAWFNQAAVELLTLRGQQDIGQRIVNLLRQPEFNQYFLHGEDAEAGVEISAPADPTRTLWVRTIRYGSGQCLLIARDVTKLKRIEQSRRDFVANASHELRTPLTVVSGYLDMMLVESRQAADLSPWADPIAEMSRQASRMNQIISDLLKLANLESRRFNPEAQEVNMPALIGAALEEAEILSAGRHRFEVKVDESLNLMGLASDLQSVIANLLSNAIRYTPKDGCIKLEWRRDEEHGVLCVHDSGIGIAAEDLPRLTERFYRADAARSRETGGTGLGLAIVKHALERHGAHLVVSSRVGEGSEFRCEFPANRLRARALSEIDRTAS